MAKRPTRRTEFGISKTVGYGWVGRWRDDTLGWFLPSHLGCGVNEPQTTDWNNGEKAVLCKINVEQVFGSDGREIVRTVPTTTSERYIRSRAAVDPV